MITRIITVGPQRLGNLLLSLRFDDFLDPQPDVTIIITPLDPIQVRSTISETFPQLKFEVVSDDYLIDFYPDIELWKDQNNFRAGWLKQQALKLAALDHYTSDVFLIQDPDTFCIARYQYYNQGKLCLLIVPEQFHYAGYYSTLEKVLAISRQTCDSFVTEFMPVTYQDWQSCKKRIESEIKAHWLHLIQHVPFELFGGVRPVRWFSEYELLGNWHVYNNQPNTSVQSRFVYNSLEQLQDLNAEYTAVCDRGIKGQIRGEASIFSDNLCVNRETINQTEQIVRSKIC